jgi:hypothetical protein
MFVWKRKVMTPALLATGKVETDSKGIASRDRLNCSKGIVLFGGELRVSNLRCFESSLDIHPWKH